MDLSIYIAIDWNKISSVIYNYQTELTDNIYSIEYSPLIEKYLNNNETYTIYCSSSIGNDENDGKSENSPVATISKALSLSSNILLKRGDIFYENIKANNIRVNAYGIGQKPILCGFKEIKNNTWVKGSFDAQGAWSENTNGNI